MATTAVFAEILIIGLQVEAWLALVLFTLFGTDWVDLDGVSDYASLVTVVVLALAYVLGIIGDRLADTVLDRFERTKRGRRIKRRLSKDRSPKPAKVSVMRMRVMHAGEGMARFLDYQRSRWRIARATVLNLTFAGVAAALYLGFRGGDARAWAFVPLACGVVLMPITYFAAVRIQDAFVGRLTDAYWIVGGTPQIVAAVCHRAKTDGIELLLVRTKGGDRWTFPKGHVEPGELPHEAAAREAREEAGAEGEVAAKALTNYRYPATRDDEDDSLVSAYLLSVLRQRDVAEGERRREPTWVSPGEATQLLTAGGREPEYAEEHARVVREAVGALGN